MEKTTDTKVKEPIYKVIPFEAVKVALAKAPEHTEFSKLDEMLRFYFGFYKSHILHLNVIKKNHFDTEMGMTPS